MASRFRGVIPYVIPGVLALLGCWWIYSHRKKHASYHDKQAIAIEEEQQEDVPEDDSSPKTEACVPQRPPLSSEEERPENETSTSLLSAGSMMPSLLCETHERLELSQDLPDLSDTTIQPSTLEDDSEKLETIGSPDESNVPACASLPLISKGAECHSSAAVSLRQDSSSSANQDRWPSASLTLTQKSLGITESSNAEQLGESSLKPAKESQMPELVLSDADSERAVCLGLEKGANTPQAFLNNEVEVVSSHSDSAVSMLLGNLESACLEQSKEEELSESIASTTPVCQEEDDTQPQGDEFERDKIAGVTLDKEEVDKIEKAAIEIVSEVTLAAVEEVLSGAAGDVSTQSCQAAASQAETPLEMASVVSSDQMLVAEARATGENIAAKRDAVALASPQAAEQDQSATNSSCSARGRLQGDAKDRRVKNRACSEEVDINSMDFVDSGCAMRRRVTRQNAKLGGASRKSDHVIWEIEVPKDLVGRLIGKQGRFMNSLRQASGAKIYVSTLPYFRDSQVCHIEGSSQQVEKVLSLIGKKFKELCLTNIYGLPPPTPLTLHSLLMTAWLFLPDGVTVEVVVAHQVDAGHMFLQQHTHPTFRVLRSLDQQMYACYSEPEIPTLPTPVEVGIICAAPGPDGAWLRAQVISYFEESNEVELRYVDYGGYDKVKTDTLRQIRSDFLSLPFQGAEVLLDNVVPLPDEDHFSSEADAAVSEMTRGAALVAQVTNYDNATGLPLIQLWNLTGDEVVSVNRALVERGFAQWLDY
ncbi:A-kinase anchor protein 1, mitochondrial-like [Morus bassanus]